MAKQITMTLDARLTPIRSSIAETTTLAEPGALEITISAGSNVSPNSRIVEHRNTFKWLWQGVVERGLLNSQFAGATLVTGVDIDKRSVADRRTASTLAAMSATDTDLIIGIGASVSDSLPGKQAMHMVKEAFGLLINEWNG